MIADALIAKQKAGVQVNLIRDSVGTMTTPVEFFTRLTEAGINVLEFNPVNPLDTVAAGWDVNERDHRKLLVVDGKVAFLGGINISSVYSRGSFRQASKVRPDGTPPWRDTDLQIEGPAVTEVQKLCLETWEKLKGAPLAPRNYLPEPVATGREVVRIIGSSPDEPISLIYATLISALRSAETEIWIANAYGAVAQDASALRTRHTQLLHQLAGNQFGQPLYLESSDESGTLRDDVYATVDYPFPVAGPALQDMNHWCDILILHQNVKSCRATGPPAQDALSLNIGRKFDQPLADAYPFEFLFRVAAAGPDYLHATLNADQGPMGTSHYRIDLEVVGLDAGRSFVHMSYSYAYGTMASMAMQGYLATIGRNKVGFTIAGRKPGGSPDFTGGTRGVVERNTMRYYLAIEAYLAALPEPPEEQLEKRLSGWYARVERYPAQLHELERDDYLAMKRKEARRR